MQVILCGSPVLTIIRQYFFRLFAATPPLINNNLQPIDSENNLPPGKRRVENIKIFVSQNLSLNLHAGVVAKKFKLSSSSLHHVFKKYEPQSYRLHVEEMRMNKAFELLQAEGIRIKEVMYATGYHNRVTFTNAFKKKFGHAPLYYKK